MRNQLWTASTGEEVSALYKRQSKINQEKRVRTLEKV